MQARHLIGLGIVNLLERNISPAVLRILIYMYMNQTLRVQWCQTLTSSFKVCNGVKQGGVLSPILFVVYVDSLLGRLGARWCKFSHRRTFCLVLWLMLMTLHWLCQINKIYILLLMFVKQFALDYDITFNCTKKSTNVF